jgi:hypothetical protein
LYREGSVIWKQIIQKNEEQWKAIFN